MLEKYINYHILFLTIVIGIGYKYMTDKKDYLIVIRNK